MIFVILIFVSTSLRPRDLKLIPKSNLATAGTEYHIKSSDGNYHPIWSQKLDACEELPKIRVFSHGAYVMHGSVNGHFEPVLRDLPGEIGKNCKTCLT